MDNSLRNFETLSSIEDEDSVAATGAGGGTVASKTGGGSEGATTVCGGASSSNQSGFKPACCIFMRTAALGAPILNNFRNGVKSGIVEVSDASLGRTRGGLMGVPGITCGRAGVRAGKIKDVFSGVEGGKDPVANANTGRLASFFTLAVAMGVGAGAEGSACPFFKC